jgi:hypothetical protein
MIEVKTLCTTIRIARDDHEGVVAFMPVLSGLRILAHKTSVRFFIDMSDETLARFSSTKIFYHNKRHFCNKKECFENFFDTKCTKRAMEGGSIALF